MMNVYKLTLDGWVIYASNLQAWAATKLAASAEFNTKIPHRVAKNPPADIL